MLEDRYDVRPPAERLRYDAEMFRRDAAKLSERADQSDEEAVRHRRNAATLLEAADQADDAADALDNGAKDDWIGVPPPVGKVVTRFKTSGSTYWIDEESKTWGREPTHGRSGAMPQNAGEFRSHTLAVVGVRVVIVDTMLGTFRTSAITEMLT